MQPVLTQLWGFEVQSYGFFIALGLVLGWALSLRLARADRLPADRLGMVYVASAAAAVFGARAVWVLQHPGAYRGLESIFTLQAGTLAPFAGVTIGALVSGAMVTTRKVPVMAWYDVVAPAFALGVVLERIGALLAGSGAGHYAPDLAFAIRYPADSPVFAEHRHQLASLLPAGATESLPVHPAPVYGIALGVIGIAVCVWLRRRRRFSGETFIGYAMWLLASRSFIEEWFRADKAVAVLGPVNPGQIAAVAMLVGLGVAYRMLLARSSGGRRRFWEGGPWSPSEAATGPRAASKSAATRTGGKKRSSE